MKWQRISERLWGSPGTVASLPGPSRTITVEPIEVPSEQPEPVEQPSLPEREPTPVKEPEKLPG